MSHARQQTRQHHGQAFFTQAGKELRVLLLSLLKDINDPLDQVALHSQLLVHLWVRPFEDFVVRCRSNVLEPAHRQQLHFVLRKLSERITYALRQDPLATSLQQLRAAARILRDGYTFEECAHAFNWEISAGERADAAGSQRFINDTITLEDLANVRVPASRTDLPDYRMPEYKTWNNRLLGLIGVSVVGEDYIRGQEGWTKVRAILAAKDEELPDKLYSWMEELKEHLSREWYGTPEAKWWLQWLKDFQERVQTVSKRWGFVTAGRYILAQDYQSLQSQVNRYKPSQTAVAGQLEQVSSSDSPGLWLEEHGPKQCQRKRKSSPQSPHSPRGRQKKRIMPALAASLPATQMAVYGARRPVPVSATLAPDDQHLDESGPLPGNYPLPVEPARNAQPLSAFDVTNRSALAPHPRALPLHYYQHDPAGQMQNWQQRDPGNPFVAPAGQLAFDPDLLDPDYFGPLLPNPPPPLSYDPIKGAMPHHPQHLSTIFAPPTQTSSTTGPLCEYTPAQHGQVTFATQPQVLHGWQPMHQAFSTVLSPAAAASSPNHPPPAPEYNPFEVAMLQYPQDPSTIFAPPTQTSSTAGPLLPYTPAQHGQVTVAAQPQFPHGWHSMHQAFPTVLNPAAAANSPKPSFPAAHNLFWTPATHAVNQSAFHLPEGEQWQQHPTGGPYFQALGHHPRIANRIARKVYGIDPDLWSRRARL